MYRTFVSLVVALVVCINSVSSLYCPNGYTLHDGICYDFRSPGGAMDWDSCYNMCTSANAIMPCVQNIDQQNYLVANRAGSSFWVGAYKTPGTNDWNWPTGCTSSFLYLNQGEGFIQNEPVALSYAGTPEGYWADCPKSWTGLCFCQTNALIEPTSQPSEQPTSQPSRQPTSQPSQPTSHPSISAVHHDYILSSPSYQPRNGFAFVARTSTGRVETWGEAQYGGDSSAVQSLLTVGYGQVVHTRFSFIGLKNDGTIAPWGNAADLRGTSGFATLPQFRFITSNDAAYALVGAGTGAVHTFGSNNHGGDITDTTRCPGCAAALASNVDYVVASAGAFCAVKMDGSAFVWGGKHYGGVPSDQVKAALQSIVMVAATTSAFAALLSTGRVVAWGDINTGGDASAVDSQLREIWHLSSSKSSFVAFKPNGGIIVWGDSVYADTSAVSAQLSSGGVVYVAHTFVASAALKADGTVVTWGRADGGGDSSAVQAQLHDIIKVFGNGKAFAALTDVGGVVTWGKASDGGQIPADKVSALSSEVAVIYHTDRAFAALKGGGLLIAWGQAGHGGNPGAAVEALLSSGVHTVCANDVAFSAIKTDGSVVAWGHSVSVPTQGVQFTSAHMTSDMTCR